MEAEEITCTLSEMIEQDLLNGGICEPQYYKGFTVRNGKQLFWYVKPTPNGYYAIYPKLEGGRLGYPRYVDANKTIVTVHPEK